MQGVVDLGCRLSSQQFAERIHRNRCVLDLDDVEITPSLLGRAGSAGRRGSSSSAHWRGNERQQSAQPRSEVHRIDAYDRDDVFEAGGKSL